MAQNGKRLGGRPTGKKKASKAPVGSGGKNRRGLSGHGPTPKAEDRVYHKAYKERKDRERREFADPRLAARRHVAKIVSDTDDLVIGRNSVLEALRVGVPAKDLFIAMRLEPDDRTREIIQLAGNHGIHIMEADRLEMDKIAHSKGHQGVVLKVNPYEYASLRTLADKADAQHAASPADPSRTPLFVALDGVTDPHNLGAVIRSAAAFGATGIILPERRAASVTAAAWKVSAGAAAHLPVARVVNLTKAIEALKERGYYAIGLDGGGDSLVGGTGFEKDPLIIVLGSEGKGISRLVSQACDAIASIPIGRDVESLNASVAAGIALYATSVARRA
jgi:23S rRNA (guanosine2251-2'-O)-methyltransferase